MFNGIAARWRILFASRRSSAMNVAGLRGLFDRLPQLSALRTQLPVGLVREAADNWNFPHQTLGGIASPNTSAKYPGGSSEHMDGNIERLVRELQSLAPVIARVRTKRLHLAQG